MIYYQLVGNFIPPTSFPMTSFPTTIFPIIIFPTRVQNTHYFWQPLNVNFFLHAWKCTLFPTHWKKIYFFRHTAKIHFFQNLHNLPNLLYSCWLKNSTSFSTQQPQSRGARGSRTLTNPLVPKKVSSYEYQPPVRAMKPNLVSLGQVSVLILL